MGALSFLLKAAAPAAEAVGSYDQGQRERQLQNYGLERQSKLDQIDQALKQSQISEDQARANWFNRPPPLNRNVTTAKDGNQYLIGEDGTAVPITGPDGTQIQGAPKARTATLHSQIVDPTSKKVMNLYNDGSMEPVRDATPAELARANKVPRDPTDPAPELPDVAAKRKADNTAAAADRVVQRFLGQNPNLAGSHNLSTDMETYLGGLQRNGDADAKDLAIGDINSALGRRVKPPSATDALMQQAISGGPPPVAGASPAPTPGAASGAAPSSGGALSRIESAVAGKKSAAPTPSASIGAAPSQPSPSQPSAPKPAKEDGTATRADSALAAQNPRVSEAVRRIRAGVATVDQLDNSPSFLPGEKKVIKRLLGRSIR